MASMTAVSSVIFLSMTLGSHSSSEVKTIWIKYFYSLTEKGLMGTYGKPLIKFIGMKNPSNVVIHCSPLCSFFDLL